jgi:hypothetical protein
MTPPVDSAPPAGAAASQVVEDAPELLVRLSGDFAAGGYPTLVAADGEAAIRLARTGPVAPGAVRAAGPESQPPGRAREVHSVRREGTALPAEVKSRPWRRRRARA